MAQFDDDEGELLTTFNSLRVQIVRVSSAFGARLGVRLRALSAASDGTDPSVIEVFGSTVVDAIDLMSAPLSPDPSAVDAPDTKPDNNAGLAVDPPASETANGASDRDAETESNDE